MRTNLFEGSSVLYRQPGSQADRQTGRQADRLYLLVRPALRLRFIALQFSIITLALMAMNDTAHAGGEILPQPVFWQSYNQYAFYPDQNQACLAEAQRESAFQGWAYISVDSCYLNPNDPNYLLGTFSFNARNATQISQTRMVAGIARVTCPAHSSPTASSNITCNCSDGYFPDPSKTSCVPVATCPANSSRSDLYPFQCTCNTGYKFDGVGGICVPLRECTIPDLPPIIDPEVQLFEDSPNRADTERLSLRMQTALTCLQAAAVSPSVGSAFRPPAYNQHLIDVWKKWDELEINKNYDQQDCAARKEKIRLHFKTHGLLETQQPVPGSDHTRGEAVDVTINLPPANIDALAAGCHLRRPKPVKDKVHFIYQ